MVSIGARRRSRTTAPALDLATGRTQQKARTRTALVDAAMALLAEGKVFSLADVADRAQVSRTTAYNYFPTLESLHSQAVVTFVSQVDIPDFSERFAAVADVRERVRIVVEASDAVVVKHEHLYRAMLRESLGGREHDVPRRPRYRMQWLSEALAPLRGRLERRAFERLVARLSLTVGVEAHVTLRDVCGLTVQEAKRAKLEAADAQLAQVLSRLR
jgi:AcrR family transcriptional regulator